MSEEMIETPKEKKTKSKDKLLAKRAFHIFQPGVIDLKIAAGDDVSTLAKPFLDNLKTEGVI